MEGSGTNVALGVYGANTILSPALTQNRVSLNSELSLMNLVGGERQMSSALNVASRLYGGRGNNGKVYVIFAAGDNAIADNAAFAQAVNSIKSSKDEVVVFALGNTVNMAQFKQVIISRSHLFQAYTLNGIPDLLHNMIILNMPGKPWFTLLHYLTQALLTQVL